MSMIKKIIELIAKVCCKIPSLMGSLVLFVLFCLILVICCFVAIDAFFNHKENNLNISKELTKAARCVCVIDVNDVKDIEGFYKFKKDAEDYLERVNSLSKSAAQSGTVTFLFTVFSVALVSGGVYLLERSRQNVKDVENKVKDFENKIEHLKREIADTRKLAINLVGDILQIESITANFLSAQQISSVLRKATTQEGILSNIPAERDLLNLIYDELKKIVDKLSIEQRKAYYNRMLNIKVDLENVPDTFKNIVEDLIERCDKILELLD